MAQTVKRLPTMQETRVQSLGQEDPLEKEMATHSSTLAWNIPWIEEHGRLQSMRSQSWTQLSNFTSLQPLTVAFVMHKAYQLWRQNSCYIEIPTHHLLAPLLRWCSFGSSDVGTLTEASHCQVLVRWEPCLRGKTMMCFLGHEWDGYTVLKSFHQGHLWAQGCFLQDISSGSIPRPSTACHRAIVSGLFQVRPWFHWLASQWSMHWDYIS